MTSPAREPETIEARDVRARPLVLAGLGLIAGVAASAALVDAVMGVLHFHRPPPVSPAALSAQDAPRLQVTPAADRIRIEERSRRLLERRAWLDKEHTRARIPIARAMDLLAAKGWPDAEDRQP